MTAAEALARAVDRLREAGIEDPARDARRLLAFALGIEPGRVTLILPDALPDTAPFLDLIRRRAANEPVSKIIGRRAFRGRDFLVTPDVLDPRPDSELLVDLGLGEDFSRVLDLGTGSGCLLLSLLAERPPTAGVGVDISEPALRVAGRNAAAFGLGDRVTLVQGDWYGPVTGEFDLIVSNPPYIAAWEMTGLAPEVRDWDPAVALTDGGDGLSAFRAILSGHERHLAPGGRLIVEIGWRQGDAVRGMFCQAGLVAITVHADLDGRDRAVSGRKP